MLIDLFSLFDMDTFISPRAEGYLMVLFWVWSLVLPVFLVQASPWVGGAGPWVFFIKPAMTWLTKKHSYKGNDLQASLLVASAVSWVGLSTVCQALPGGFISLSHLSVTAALAFPLWSGMVLSSVFDSGNKFLSSLVPVGTPWYLMPALVLIEVFSHAMRPLALCLRLSLTMMTGHMMLGLLWAMTSEAPVPSYEVLVPPSEALIFFPEELGLIWALDGLNVHATASSAAAVDLVWSILLGALSLFVTFVEVAIGLLQSYIFFSLLCFYTSEYPSDLK